LRAVHEDNVELLIAGNVRDSDDPRNEKAVYGKAVVARIEQTPGARWVGSLPPQDIHEFLIAGDIFVLPSLWADPFPTVMLEAAAAGIPIVAAARGGMTEFLADCPGFDADMRPEDPESLSSAIERYLLDEEGRRVAGNWLRTRVEAQFDWSRVCSDMEELYDRLLNPGIPRS
jgi:glycosyltransferase involved in cell wall biosynthesis